MSTPIGATITHDSTSTTISENERQHLLDLASWRREPTFSVRGRGAWHVLQSDAALKSNPKFKFYAAKMKGVGVYNPQGSAHRDSLMVPVGDRPMPPSTAPLESFQGYPHFGFDGNGEFALVQSKISPIGGILHDRAILEFDNAKLLTEHGLPCIAPLFVLGYDDKYRFDGMTMGAVISLSPSLAPFRISELKYGVVTRLDRSLNEEDQAKVTFCQRILDTMGIDGDLADETTRMKAIGPLAKESGKLIHDFSAAGLYRYSPEWGNFEYSFDMGCLVLTDLDSSRPLAELAAELQALQVMRDLGSLIYRTMAKFTTPPAIDKYSLSAILEHDPVAAILLGYFKHISDDMACVISRRLWRLYIPHIFTLKQYRHQIQNDWSQERRRSYKMAHDMVYILAMISTVQLYRESDLFELYPTDLTEEDLLRKAHRYLGVRFEYLQYLLSDDKFF